jgi:hypothetical protein
MKTTATILIISLLTAHLMAADPTLAPLSLEQRFQQVDIELAVEQYEKLSRAMFDTQSKLEFDTEPPLSDEQRKHLRAKLEKLQQGVDQLRARARADADEHSK